MKCPKCSYESIENFKFCPECGKCLTETAQKPLQSTGERKHATVLFSDLSGYTAMTEKIDPEDVKCLMEDIFEKAAKIVEKYDGTVDSFFGDEILILFGVPKVHEDDPIRAIHTAIEIHNLVAEYSHGFENLHNCKLSMHSGINSGLVVTGDKFIGKGRQGLAGDAINLASRLTKIANPGEIIVGQDTFKIAENYFTFEPCKPVQVKGKKFPIPIFKVIDAAKKTKRIKQLHGVRAELIGRDKELSIFYNAVTHLKKGNGSVICLYGSAGTGKSRLIEEFKSITNIQWFEGYSYPYTMNIPYFPLISLFNEAFGIKEDDSPDIIKAKIENSINSLIENSENIIPYIGTLYSLSYQKNENVSPEFWKSKLFDAVPKILSALADKQPVIISIEDLHWTDPSFLELIRHIQFKLEKPILFLYVSRPVIEVFSDRHKERLDSKYIEIRIEDLSIADSHMMVKSLLKTENIPSGLKFLIEKKTQGNPFYLEEIINSLIESNVLIKKLGDWVLQREISDSDISSSIHGVISARVDRLESESKRILQEASVIGRAFYYEIINKITEIKQDISQYLEKLEEFDLIKPRKSNVDLEYIFKHALTQEVVYNGLLKTDRQIIHEKIGLVIEQFFKDRLPEFYETLAHHFSKGISILKAVDYLMLSGEKSLKKSSFKESHLYFQKAFDLIESMSEKTEKIKETTIDLICRWAFVYYYRGDYKNLGKLISSQADLITQINDKEKIGMFYAWQGNFLWMRGQYQNARKILEKAEKIGTEIGSKKIIGYSCAWLSWIFADLGDFKTGIAYGEKAIEIGENCKEDPYIYFKSLAGVCLNLFWSGHAAKCINKGEQLIHFGKEHSQIRSLGMGYSFTGGGYSNSGDFIKGLSLTQQAVSVAVDPFYSLGFRTMLVLLYIQNNNFIMADETVQDCLTQAKENCNEIFGDLAYLFNGLILIDKGHMSEGLKSIVNAEKGFISQERMGALPVAKLIRAKVYFEIIKRSKTPNPSQIFKNFGFIIRNVPSAYGKAVSQYNQAIEIADKIGALGMSAQAHLDLGVIYKTKNHVEKAKKHLKTAISIFESIGAFRFLKQANKELNDLI